MLRVSDNSTGISYAYIRKDFQTIPRSNIVLEFDFTPNILNIRDVQIALLKGTGDVPLASIVMGADGYLKLKSWNYNTYPSQKAYPGPNRFPKGTRRTFPPFYPSANVRAGQDPLYPPFFPEPKLYPTVKYNGESINYFPGHSQPVPQKTINATSKTSVRLTVSNPNSISPRVYLYASRTGIRGKEVQTGVLNWKLKTIQSVDLGCTFSNNTAYDFSFENILLSGDVPSDEWYLIENHQAFDIANADKNVLWEGAVDIFDITTYTEPTKLVNLARYDYARPKSNLSVVPKGMSWSLPPGPPEFITREFSIARSEDDQIIETESAVYPTPTNSPPYRVLDQNDIRPVRYFWSGGPMYYVANALLRWDTSSLPDNAVILSATLRGFVVNNENANGLKLTADWYPWSGSTNFDHSFAPKKGAISGIPLSAIIMNQDNDFPLEDAQYNISKVGYTKLRLHLSDVVPPGANALKIASFEHTTLPPPRLIVTYNLLS